MKFRRRQIDSEIPTSSMADIAFLLIVYFMITTTFAATRGLDFALPEEEENPPEIEPEEAVLIEIQPSRDIVVDGKPMRYNEIMAYLMPKLEVNPKKPVIIKPDPNAPYGAMVRVFDTLRQGEKANDIKINVSIPTQREIERFWF